MSNVDNLKIGTLVRTSNNGIKRIDTIFENKTVNKYGYEIGSEWDGKLYSIIKITDIVKHSVDLIDLLEVGDFVNKCRVCEVTKNYVYCNDYSIEFRENEIKSIVTKEQFMQSEFCI